MIDSHGENMAILVFKLFIELSYVFSFFVYILPCVDFSLCLDIGEGKIKLSKIFSQSRLVPIMEYRLQRGQDLSVVVPLFGSFGFCLHFLSISYKLFIN